MSDGDTYGILNFRPDHKFEFRDLGVSGSWSGDADNFNADFDDSFKGERFTGGVVQGVLYIRHNRFGAVSDFSRLAVLSHNLKGTGNGYGFAELTRLGAALEQFAKQKDSGSLRAHVTELGDYLDKVQLVARIAE